MKRWRHHDSGFFSDIARKGLGSTVDNIAFGTVVNDYKMEWVVIVGIGPISFGSTGRTFVVASPNGGDMPQHVGTAPNLGRLHHCWVLYLLRLNVGMALP